MKKVHNIYLYNGSFCHLLSLIKHLFKENIIPLDIKEESYNPNLFDETIKLDVKEEEEIIPKIIQNLGTRIFNGLFYLYLSDKENKGMLIYTFLLYSLKYQDKVFLMRKNDIINEALKTIQYVGRENHKFKGFVRFKELQNKVLWAQIAPTCNILPILVKHFQKRLPKETWLIEDVKRNYIAFYNQKEITFLEDVQINFNEYSLDEEKFATMWQVFYDTVGITMRKNEKCRRNFMPKKYWRFITEVSDL